MCRGDDTSLYLLIQTDDRKDVNLRIDIFNLSLRSTLFIYEPCEEVVLVGFLVVLVVVVVNDSWKSFSRSRASKAVSSVSAKRTWLT